MGRRLASYALSEIMPGEGALRATVINDRFSPAAATLKSHTVWQIGTMGNTNIRGSASTSTSRLMGTYFHGGVAGLAVGDFIMSASELGLSYRYSGTGLYNPKHLYVTRDLRLALGYAAKAVDRRGRESDGAVYEVQVDRSLLVDPDFAAGVSFMTPHRARIVRVVQPQVSFSQVESLRQLSTFMAWGDLPMYDLNGYMLPSAQMTQAGVTPEYLRFFGPWIYPSEISGKGKPTKMSSTMQETILRSFPVLDRDHQIIGLLDHPRWWGRLCLLAPRYMCSCGRRLPNGFEAVLHQIGKRELLVIGRTTGWFPPVSDNATWQAFVGSVALAAKQLKPERWSWTPSPKR